MVYRLRTNTSLWTLFHCLMLLKILSQVGAHIQAILNIFVYKLRSLCCFQCSQICIEREILRSQGPHFESLNTTLGQTILFKLPFGRTLDFCKYVGRSYEKNVQSSPATNSCTKHKLNNFLTVRIERNKFTFIL